MPNIVETPVDVGSVVLTDDQCEYEDGLLVFGGAGTMKAGTILARSTGNFVPYVVGSNTPVAVLPYEVSRDGAGNSPIRALIAGTVKKQRLVVHAAGDDSTITPAVRDLLRQTSIIPVDVQQLAQLDINADS